MKLKRIRLRQFRNYTDREFVFNESGAIIIGPNGCGKTNLFEAIAYSSLGKSFRYNADEQLLLFNTRQFSIDADFFLASGECNILSKYETGKKNICINQIPIRQLSQIYEYVKVIYCSPEDIYLVNGSPRKRRQYFDMAIAQLIPHYIAELRHYLHITDQRNTLLKDKANHSQKKHWDEIYIQAALPIIGMRLQYIDKLNAKIAKCYKDILAEADSLRIIYKPTLNPIMEEPRPTHYHDELARIEHREWQYQRSLIGPHLDEYDICFGDRLLRDIGSQGQKRTVTLLIKIAQLELIKDAIGEYPILLLDDIFAELDRKHTQLFMNILRHHEQVFIASPKEITSKFLNELPIFRLKNQVSAK